MRILRKVTLALSTLAFCASCTSEDDIFLSGVNLENGLTATVPAYQFDDGTRVNISDDLQTFTWSDGDELGIFYSDDNTNAQVGFSIKQGGNSTGVFSNDIFYMNPDKAYYAFYPYNDEFTPSAAEVDFTGQVQTANNSAAHLGAYNYMYGSVNIAKDRNASVDFNNLGTVMAMRLEAPLSGVFKSLTVSSNNEAFIIKGKASMVDGTVTASETSTTVTLLFGEDGIFLDKNSVLTAYMLIAPVNMESSTLTFTLTDNQGFRYDLAMAGKNMMAGKAYLYEGLLNEPPYITFTADSEQTFRFNSFSSHSYDYRDETPLDNLMATLEYSINNQEWVVLDSAYTITFGGDKGTLRIRGRNLYGTSSNTDFLWGNYSRIEFGNNVPVACSGDIRTLIDYQYYYSVETGHAHFRNLFRGCTQLISAPELPSMELDMYCYYEMFLGCTSLIEAPELPATSLNHSCYEGMFSGCTSLIKAPELPATNLNSNCYKSMFSGCTSLTNAPELPATNFLPYCYEKMFSGCTSLTKAPELPATSLSWYSYAEMFSGCTSLTEAPQLPAKTLEKGCYAGMFSGCTSLTIVPELPATMLAEKCYSNMFQNCTSLISAPELPGTTLAEECYYEMFSGCTSLTVAPGLPATTLAKACYNSMFSGCTSLTFAPELPATKLTPECYLGMFSGCTSLTQAPELSATDLAIDYLDQWNYDERMRGCYYGMFSGCTSLTEAPKLPATKLTPYCYYGMFSGCTSLTEAPELPALKLVKACYYNMFDSCSNLSYIKMMATDINADDWTCLAGWTSGVASTGTFVKNAAATWDYTGVSGIPRGWTVEYADE